MCHSLNSDTDTSVITFHVMHTVFVNKLIFKLYEKKMNSDRVATAYV